MSMGDQDVLFIFKKTWDPKWTYGTKQIKKDLELESFIGISSLFTFNGICKSSADFKNPKTFFFFFGREEFHDQQ